MSILSALGIHIDRLRRPIGLDLNGYLYDKCRPEADIRYNGAIKLGLVRLSVSESGSQSKPTITENS